MTYIFLFTVYKDVSNTFLTQLLIEFDNPVVWLYTYKKNLQVSSYYYVPEKLSHILFTKSFQMGLPGWTWLLDTFHYFLVQSLGHWTSFYSPGLIQ